MHPDDFLWFQNRISSLEQELQQAQAEVERLTLFIEIDIPRIVTSRLNELKQVLNPQEAEPQTSISLTTEYAYGEWHTCKKCGGRGCVGGCQLEAEDAPA